MKIKELRICERLINLIAVSSHGLSTKSLRLYMWRLLSWKNLMDDLL